jgi:hypothetical protein
LIGPQTKSNQKGTYSSPALGHNRFCFLANQLTVYANTNRYFDTQKGLYMDMADKTQKHSRILIKEMHKRIHKAGHKQWQGHERQR